MTGSAALLADAGASSCGDEFFRSAEFLAAERVTHTLVLTTGTARLQLPLLVRPIDGTDAQDAISPYGYPGGQLDGAPLDPATLDLTGIGLVSMFVRDRVERPTFVGGTRRAPIYEHDPGLPPGANATFRKHVRRNERRGLKATATRGPDVDQEALRAFTALYADTMLRAAASPRYFFPERYIEQILQFPDSWLFTAHTADDVPAAASIAVRSDGRLHYFLEGTQEQHRETSPGKNCVDLALRLADELGLPLNFGGGLHPDDGIATFKRSFCNTAHRFVTHEIVCDPAAYAHLSAEQAGTDFFPAYRGRSS